jgi:zinc D-Ala-D-Ala dipeptidase
MIERMAAAEGSTKEACRRATALAPLSMLLVLIVTPAAVAGSAKSPPTAASGASELVEIVRLDPTIRLDIRYATPDNFTGRAVYPEARAFLQRPAAEALIVAQRWLRERGYGLVVYDAYRPWSVTKLFWDITPPARRAFVAKPSAGSVHNRGCAVDVGLVDLKSGRAREMPSAYDEMSVRASVAYKGGTLEQRAHRDLLRQAMERDGQFVVAPGEWWHYNFKGYRTYAIQDVPFSELAK